MTKEIAKQQTVDLTAMLKAENEKRDIINRYIEENLKPGIDYGTINIKGVESKPSLFKPGGEKMCNLFHLTPRFSRDDDTWEMLGKKEGLVCYKCDLASKEDSIVGEGRGTALTPMDNDFNVNKQVKLAEKRAQIDAVLRVFGLSERFTQDMEDFSTTKENVVSKKESRPVTGREESPERKTEYYRFWKLASKLIGDDKEKIKKFATDKYNVRSMYDLSVDNFKEMNSSMQEKLEEEAKRLEGTSLGAVIGKEVDETVDPDELPF